MLYYNELKKLQQRIQQLEKTKGTGDKQMGKDDSEEDWEELYYQSGDEKEKLENELDLTTQKLEEAEFLIV